jgi:hypothetical protein
VNCVALDLDTIQGADDKLGQFLDQDIEATANHRNVLGHSLESCPSLVSPNVNKPSIFTKICRQSTKLVQQSLKLCTPEEIYMRLQGF